MQSTKRAASAPRRREQLARECAALGLKPPPLGYLPPAFGKKTLYPVVEQIWRDTRWYVYTRFQHHVETFVMRLASDRASCGAPGRDGVAWGRLCAFADALGPASLFVYV